MNKGGILGLAIMLVFTATIINVPVAISQQASSALTIGWIVSSPYTSLSTYNPNIFAGGLGGAFYGLIYAYSTVLNVSNNVMLPVVVQNWTFSPPDWVQRYSELVAKNATVNVTLYLNPSYHWANGQPVTAYDILATSLVLNMYSAPPYPNYTVVNNYTITISYRASWLSPYLMPFTLLRTVGLGQVAIIINYNLWKPIINQILGNWTALQQGKVSPNTFRNIIRSFNPTVYGPVPASYNGPFYVAQITPNAIVLNKNPYYPYANKIPWNQVIIYQYTSANNLLSALKTGQIDLIYSGEASLPPSQLSLLPDYYKIIIIPNPGGKALYFNFKNPWLSNVLVRQAIAYVLNRTAIAIAGGPIYKPVPVPNGILNFSYLKQFITPVVANLNPYNVNLTKARLLLEQAGFTYKGGQWYTPDGTPFTLTILLPGTNAPDQINMLTVIQNELNNFGIPTQFIIVTSLSTYHDMWNTGNGYDMSFQDWGGYFPGTVNWGLPLSYFGGYPWNVTHWDLRVKLPNGTVYNLRELYMQSISPNSTSQLITANERIAYAMNYYLPILPLVYGAYVVIYNTKTVEFPPSDSWFWNEVFYGIGGTAFLQLGFNNGYILIPSVTTTTTTSTTTSTSTTVPTSISTVTSVSTTTVTSTPAAFYAVIAVLIIIIIILVVLLIMRRR